MRNKHSISNGYKVIISILAFVIGMTILGLGNDLQLESIQNLGGATISSRNS